MNREESMISKRMLQEPEMKLYTGLGRNNAREFCKNIGAVVRIGRRVLYDKKVIDEYFDSLHKKTEER